MNKNCSWVQDNDTIIFLPCDGWMSQEANEIFNLKVGAIIATIAYSFKFCPFCGTKINKGELNV